MSVVGVDLFGVAIFAFALRRAKYFRQEWSRDQRESPLALWKYLLAFGLPIAPLITGMVILVGLSETARVFPAFCLTTGLIIVVFAEAVLRRDKYASDTKAGS